MLDALMNCSLLRARWIDRAGKAVVLLHGMDIVAFECGASSI